MRRFVLHSAQGQQAAEKIAVHPFVLDRTMATKPSEFEINFLLDEIRHEYGFLVSPQRVHEEWLSVYPKGKPQEWYHRTVDGKATRTGRSAGRTCEETRPSYTPRVPD